MRFASASEVPLPSVSVVVATYRRDRLLPICLQSVASQADDIPLAEIIVVDDACSQSTGPIVDAVAERYPALQFVLISGRSAGPAVARNLGWRRACGDVVAFIDDDARAYPGWLRCGIAHFRDPDTLAVSGAVRVPVSSPPTDFQRNVQRLEQGRFLTCNAFYRRSALEAVGGFDERFRLPFREDTDLAYRVERLAGRMVHEPDARVLHPVPRGTFGVSLRLQRYSMFNALLYKQYPDRYRRDIQARPPLAYYAICAALVASGAAIRMRRSWMALGFALIAGLLDTRFFLARLRGTSHAPRDVADMALTSILIPPLSLFWRIRGALRFRAIFL